jgi:hypothetical protein
MEINSCGNPRFEDFKITDDSKKLHFLGGVVNESVNLINCGLDYFSKINFTNEDLFYSLSFLNLSRGFELLMKCMICYKRYDDTKDNKHFEKHFPTNKEIKDYGHDLNKLREEIMKNYPELFRGKTSNTKMISQLKEDCDFISKDKKLIGILDIISEYGNKGRYYELDYVTSDNETKITERNGITYMDYKPSNNKKNSISPKFEMEKLIKEFLEKDEQLRNTFTNSTNNGDLLICNKIWQEIIEQHIKPYLNKFMEALSRQFLYGILGNKAKTKIN